MYLFLEADSALSASGTRLPAITLLLETANGLARQSATTHRFAFRTVNRLSIKANVVLRKTASII